MVIRLGQVASRRRRTATGTDVVDVGRWGQLDTPGHYRLECTYRTSFVRPGTGTFGDTGFTARVWDRTFTSTLELDIH